MQPPPPPEPAMMSSSEGDNTESEDESAFIAPENRESECRSIEREREGRSQVERWKGVYSVLNSKISRLLMWDFEYMSCWSTIQVF